MRRWGKSTVDEVLGAVLFFALCAAAMTAAGSYVQYGNIGADYVLMTLQAALGIAGMALMRRVDQKAKLALPATFYSLFYGFLFCAVFLGEMLGFYYLVPLWDAALHCYSGVMLTYLGFHLAGQYALRRNISVGAAEAAVFAACFSLALGAVWECYEYLMDGAFAMNMQKFAGESGMAFTGRGALSDTMEDILLDTAAAVTAAIVLWRRNLTRQG